MAYSTNNTRNRHSQKIPLIYPFLHYSNIREKEKKLKESSPLLELFSPPSVSLSLLAIICFEKKRDFPFRREKNRENFLVAHDSSAKYASIFFSLFFIIATSHHHSNRTIKLSHIFFTRLPSSPPYFPRFQRLFPSFLSLSLSLYLSLSLSHSFSPTKGDTVTQGK